MPGNAIFTKDLFLDKSFYFFGSVNFVSVSKVFTLLDLASSFPYNSGYIKSFSNHWPIDFFRVLGTFPKGEGSPFQIDSRQ